MDEYVTVLYHSINPISIQIQGLAVHYSKLETETRDPLRKTEQKGRAKAKTKAREAKHM